MDKKEEPKESEIIDDPAESDKPFELMPSMNIGVPEQREMGDISTLIDDNALLGIYDEITSNLRTDRGEIDTLLSNFGDMVFNDGDSSNASKEALVSLMKLKQDTADKMTKVADLMTRLKMKERDTMNAGQKSHYNQTNNVTIQSEGGRRGLIEDIEKKARQTRKKDK